LDFNFIPEIRRIYEQVTKMRVPERHPYAGDLVFTAFSGSHQDAINKGMEYMRVSGADYWEVPYLPINPADVGREYEPIIRINSQSGKGGAAYVLQTVFGYNLPKTMHPEFGVIVKTACDKAGTELSAQDIYNLFKNEYLALNDPFILKTYHVSHESGNGTPAVVCFKGKIQFKNEELEIEGRGNGPIDAFFNAIKQLGLNDYELVSYDEQAVATGSDSKAMAFIQLKAKQGVAVFGVGLDEDTSVASIKAIISAINRAAKLES
jgi:2-isopropylmalate synthase